MYCSISILFTIAFNVQAEKTVTSVNGAQVVVLNQHAVIVCVDTTRYLCVCLCMESMQDVKYVVVNCHHIPPLHPYVI